MANYDIVIFDFDGTIADTREGVFDSIKYALDAYKLPYPDDKGFNAFLGPPLHNGFADVIGVDGEMAEKLVEKYRELYTDNAMFRLKLFDGIENLLNELRKSGIKLAIASSKPEKFFEKLLKHLGIYELFDAVCGDKMHSKKNSKADIIRRAIKELSETTKSDRILMVGDRFYDVCGANEVGIDCAGVVFGFNYENELRESGAKYIAKTTDELKKIIL